MTAKVLGRHWWVDDRGWARANARLHWWLTEYAIAHLPGEERTRPVEDPWLAHVREVAASGFESGMTAAGLARALGVSREHLRQRLAAVSDWTPGALLLDLRMERALELVAKRDLSLAHVARLSGYRSPSAFSAAFRNYYGCPPGRWRRRVESSPRS